jgi:hypothetical protein
MLNGYFMILRNSPAGSHLATWEAEIARIVIGRQPGQIVLKIPISKNNQSKMD